MTPINFVRCPGKPAGPQGLNVPPECMTCLRRLAPIVGHQVWEEAPEEVPCSLKIPSEQMGS